MASSSCAPFAELFVFYQDLFRLLKVGQMGLTGTPTKPKSQQFKVKVRREDPPGLTLNTSSESEETDYRKVMIISDCSTDEEDDDDYMSDSESTTSIFTWNTGDSGYHPGDEVTTGTI